MDPALLDIKFARIGARLKVADRPRRFRTTGVISLDVQTDRKGEFFEIAGDRTNAAGAGSSTVSSSTSPTVTVGLVAPRVYPLFKNRRNS